MGWTGYPVTADFQYTVWTFIRQTYYALQERFRALGICIWPRANRQWETGTVPAGITETSFTDSSKSGIWSATNTCPPWLNGSGSGGTVCTGDGTYQGPVSWRLIIDDPASENVVEADITSWTGTGTVNYPNIRDFFTSGQLGGPTGDGDSAMSCSRLAAKKYYIIKHGGIWWSDRIMEWPNAYEYTEGTVLALTADPDDPTDFPAAPTHSLIRDDTKNWDTNEHVGRDLLLYGNDGFLKRVVVTSNTPNTLHFATKSWTPLTNKAYCVVDTGARAIPGRSPTYPATWYRGFLTKYISHTWDDATGLAGMGADFYCVTGVPCGGDESDCPGCRNELMWDADFWTDYPVSDGDWICGRVPDQPYSPDYWKTIRALQNAVEDLSASYVETAAMAGGVNAGVAYLGGADIFRVAGINTYTGTTGDVQGAVGNDGSVNNQIALTLSSTTGLVFPCQVKISVHRSNGIRTQGRGIMTNANTFVSAGTNTGCTANVEFNFTQAFDTTFTPTGCCDGPRNITIPGDNGATVYISPGWTGYNPREFKRMFRVSGVFMPDIVTPPVGEPGPQDPAQPSPWIPDPDSPTVHSCYGVGRFVKRDKSTHYIETRRPVNDYSVQQGFSDEGNSFTWAAFQTNDIARYGGDTFYGPSVTTGGNSYITADPDGPYWDRFFTGDALSERHQYLRHRQLHGMTTSGSTFYLKDSRKNWFDYQWFGGTMRTDIGTATGGSSTALIDSTKVDAHPDTPSVEAHCYWQASRFVGFAGAYCDFTVEIDRHEFDDNGVPVIVTYKRLITSGNGTTITIGWSQPLVDRTGTAFSAAGLVYRIKEPYYLNRWIDRDLILTDPDGNKHTTTIVGNADDTIFFTPIGGVTVTDGWSYEVKDPEVGSICKWNGTKWVEVKGGSDSNRLGAPTGHLQDFHKSSRQNLPTYVQRNGRYVIGDYFGPHLFNELHDAINALKTSTLTGIWTNKSSDSDPGTTPNTVSAGWSPSLFGGSCIDCVDITHVFICGPDDDSRCSGPHQDLTGMYTDSLGGVHGPTSSLITYLTYLWDDPANQSVGAATPQMSIGVTRCDEADENLTCFLNGTSSFGYYKISPSTCGIPHTTSYWAYATIDAIDSEPEPGGSVTCTVDLGPPYGVQTFTACCTAKTFSANNAGLGFRAWKQIATGSGTGNDANEYSSKVGSIALPEIPNLGSCPSAQCCADLGGGSSGYYVQRTIVFLTHTFTYHA